LYVFYVKLIITEYLEILKYTQLIINQTNSWVVSLQSTKEKIEPINEQFQVGK